jgi:signal transduction histidine kinase
VTAGNDPRDDAPVPLLAIAPDSTVVEWNAAAERVLGWRAADVLGRPAPMAGAASLAAAAAGAGAAGVETVVELHRPGGDALKARVRAAARAGGGARIAVLDVGIAAGGAWRPRFHESIIQQDGRAVGLAGAMIDSVALDLDGAPARVASGRDVTERRALDGRLAHADRLASIGTLAAAVAHELNNPLAYVIANVSFAADVLRGRTDVRAEALAALEEALQGAERMRVLVRDLRTLSRGDDGARGPVPLERMLRYAAKLAETEIWPRARLRWDVPPSLHAHGDEGRLGQVFVNLLVNAAHAIPEGALDAHEIRISAAPTPGGRVAVEIADTGCGMAPEICARIFEPFFTTKAVGRGTGLGLWVCQHLVAAHGGAIEVESAPGAGSVFRVFLPAAAAPDQASREPARADR